MANKAFERQRKIHQGAIAETAMQHLGATFEDVQKILIEQFIKNSKERGELDTHIGYELIALSDVQTRIKEHIRAGQKAAEARRKEIEQTAGGSEV